MDDHPRELQESWTAGALLQYSMLMVQEIAEMTGKPESQIGPELLRVIQRVRNMALCAEWCAEAADRLEHHRPLFSDGGARDG